jgi:MFS transporter, PPP family, 3-phenylpropionic acid transporter
VRRLLALYTVLFAAFGVASPFFAAFLADKGLHPTAIGIVIAAGTGTRLIAGPLGGRIADRLGAPRAVLVAYAAASACVALAYLASASPVLLFMTSIAHAATLAPLTPLADTLSLATAALRPRYGWIRGAGSAAFILGTLLSGQAVVRFGLAAIIWLNAVLLGCAALSARIVPHRPVPPTGRTKTDGVLALVRLPAFRRLMLVAALIQGSHAFHDSFVTIYWRSLDIPSTTIGALWSEQVACEVLDFFLLGRPLIDWIGPANASILAAGGGILRWVVLAATTSTTAAALVEPLHGLTFALQHLACMRLITMIVPPNLAATAQAFYGTVAVGLASTLLTLASGPLYAENGAGGFWLMAALCAIAIPFARSLAASARGG